MDHLKANSSENQGPIKNRSLHDSHAYKTIRAILRSDQYQHRVLVYSCFVAVFLCVCRSIVALEYLARGICINLRTAGVFFRVVRLDDRHIYTHPPDTVRKLSTFLNILIS